MRPEPICIVCGEELQPGASVVACAACETPQHQDCWLYHGHCAVYGCGCYRTTEAGEVLVKHSRLVMDFETDRVEPTYVVSGGMSGTDIAHLGIVVFPLLWLPAAVEGGWLLAVNLLFVVFPLLMFLFQVRTVAVEAGGLRLGYLLWSRRVSWSEIRTFGPDPLCGYSLALANGGSIAVPAEPGELRDLEQTVRAFIRGRSPSRS